MRRTFIASQWIPLPVPTVFAFFADPANLPPLMPAWQAARIDRITLIPPSTASPGSPIGVFAGAGTRMTISFRPVPFSLIRLRWDAEITEFVWNDHFCDIQLARGPFRHWRHCHRVYPESREGRHGTLLTDQVEYELPFGRLGEYAHSLVLSHQIEAAFAYRHRRTTELLDLPHEQNLSTPKTT